MPGHHLVVVGAGGNIGSHLIPHLGRMPAVARVTLVDRDVYRRSNLLTQDIIARDVNRWKARVQARRLARINPALEIVPIAAAVEDVPPGRLRGGVILACLDSRRARQHVNEVAWHLGVPWIDAGVAVLEGDSLLARVTVYVPGPGLPCIECAWDERDYEQLEQTYACGAGMAEPPSTGAPSSLGALTAALQAIECRLLLAGAQDRAGRQILLDAARASLVVTRFRHRPDCRLSDHGAWTIERLPLAALEMTLADVWALGGNGRALGTSPGQARPYADSPDAAAPAAAGASLQVAGRRFERRLVCAACGEARPCLRLHGTRRAAARCRGCGRPMTPVAFDALERLRAEDLSAAERARTLRGLGARVGDLLRVGGSGGFRDFEIGDDQV